MPQRDGSGRKPDPVQLRIIKGNPTGALTSKNHPPGETEVPQPHPILRGDPVASLEWVRVCKSLVEWQILTEFDHGALATYCMSFSNWFNAEKLWRNVMDTDPDARQGGFVSRNPTSGNLTQHPLYTAAKQARVDFLKACVEFGMTPSSRARFTFNQPKKSGKKTLAEDYGFGS